MAKRGSTKNQNSKNKNSKKQNKGKKNNSVKFLIFVAVAIFGIMGFSRGKDNSKVQSTIDTVKEKVVEQKENLSKKTEQSENKTSTKKTNSKSEAKVSETTKTTKTDSNKTYTVGTVALKDKLEVPICIGHNNAKDHQIRNFTYYSICYRETYEQAEWSAYKLTSEQLVKNAGRTNDFRADPQIKTSSADVYDYKGTGYDRGHLTPAADMSFSEKAMSETFYMSNMSPQTGAFNRGIWQHLEAEVRNWAKKFGRVYVVSGPILEKPASKYEKIGVNKVSIPQFYYKVILAPLYADAKDTKTPDDAKSITALGFILPNDACKGKKFWDYACSVDEVEKRTGLDFYSLLDDSAENAAEKSFDLTLWK